MKTVTVQKEDLVATLTANRVTHKQEFEEAIDGYRRAAIRKLETIKKSLENGDVDVNLYIRLDKPENHTKDYDRALAMLSFHVEDTITISAQDFTNLITDDWEWKERFVGTSSLYRS